MNYNGHHIVLSIKINTNKFLGKQIKGFELVWLNKLVLNFLLFGWLEQSFLNLYVFIDIDDISSHL